MDLELSMGFEFSYEVLQLTFMREICLEIMLIFGSHVGKNLFGSRVESNAELYHKYVQKMMYRKSCSEKGSRIQDCLGRFLIIETSLISSSNFPTSINFL